MGTVCSNHNGSKRRWTDAKALREIDALIEEAAKPASEVRGDRDADEGWF